MLFRSPVARRTCPWRRHPFGAAAAAHRLRRQLHDLEAFVHNLNTMHSRAGAQIPFSSINYGTDTSPEGRLIIEGVLLATEAGLGNGETPIFPIHIFKIKEGINYNPQDPNYDLFIRVIEICASLVPIATSYQ